jgi:hypothetical protein
MHPQTLTHQLGICSYVLERNLSELSEQESHVAPEAGGNCMNWVLGHMTRTRLVLLHLLGKELPFPLEEFNAYDDRGALARALNELPQDLMDQPAGLLRRVAGKEGAIKAPVATAAT